MSIQVFKIPCTPIVTTRRSQSLPKLKSWPIFLSSLNSWSPHPRVTTSQPDTQAPTNVWVNPWRLWLSHELRVTFSPVTSCHCGLCNPWFTTSRNLFCPWGQALMVTPHQVSKSVFIHRLPQVKPMGHTTIINNRALLYQYTLGYKSFNNVLNCYSQE